MKTRDFLRPLLLLASLLPASAMAQSISTVAGNGGDGNTGDDGQATAAETGSPVGVLASPDGGYFIGGYNIVRHVRADGIIRTVVGNGSSGSSGDGGQATNARIRGNINALALAPDGSLYLNDIFSVRRVNPAGIISTVASPNGTVNSLAFDQAGNLYIGGGCVVSRLSAGGALSRFAGTGQCGASAGDGGQASAATLTGNIYGLAVDAAGNVWLSDPDAHQVRKVGVDGVITTVTSSAYLPMGISAAAGGDMYVIDRSSSTLLRISGSGGATIVAGGGNGFSGDGGPATEAKLGMPWAVSVGTGRILIADSLNHRIRSVTTDVVPIPSVPATTCASEGYTGTKLTWCQNICEKGYTGAALDTWIHRWINRYRDLPYCAVEDGEEPPQGQPPA
ncbi:MAG TPA: hypothetical protein VLC71_07460 [Thermomonas sp.]|nr:hypothetical protein [Thermomonas sp.]